MNKKILLKVLNSLGIIIVGAVICVLLPLVLPKAFGYQVYGILSNSMEPEIATGSVVYVDSVDSESIVDGDIITYKMGSDSSVVATHRVVSVNKDKKEFVTKGDHNNTVDAQPVSYDRMLGKVVFSIPFLGEISTVIYSVNGIATIIILFSFAIAMWIAADYLKNKKVVEGK